MTQGLIVGKPESAPVRILSGNLSCQLIKFVLQEADGEEIFKMQVQSGALSETNGRQNKSVCGGGRSETADLGETFPRTVLDTRIDNSASQAND